MSFPFDIDELRTFVLLAENGHFTETAKILGISQPAVSQRIAKLENSFGLVLFNRAAERAILTPYGARILPKSRRCVEQHIALTARLTADSPPRENDKFYLWIERSSLGREAAWVEEVLSSLTSEVHLMSELPGNDWQSALGSGECDGVVAGTFLPDSSPCSLIRHSLECEPGLSALWSNRHTDLALRMWDFEEILDRELVMVSDSITAGFRSLVEDWCWRVYGRMPAKIMEVGSYREVLEAVRAAGRVGLIPGLAANRFDLDDETASRSFFVDMIPNAFECALYTSGAQASASVELVLAKLRLKFGILEGAGVK